MRDLRAVLIVGLTAGAFFIVSSVWLAAAMWMAGHAFWIGVAMALVWLAATGLFFNVYHWMDRVIPRMPRRD